MALFPKNANESAYVGGRKHWVDVIKNSGPGDALIWRQPEEDFNTNSTLIVMPGEEAIFVHNGTVEELFSEGSYKLSTENYPFISRLRTAFSGGISSFHCTVYYVNITDSMEIRWGTPSRIPVRDKVMNFTTSVGAHGAYRIRINDAVKFFRKLSGSKVNCQYKEDLSDYFSSQLLGKIMSAVSTLLNSLELELIGINSRIEELSAQMEPYMDSVLSEYGLKCVNFSFESLDIDTENYKKIDDFNIKAYGTVAGIRAGYQGEAAGIQILGQQGYRFYKGAEILNNVAQNQGASGAAVSMGAGIGMGIGTVGVFNTVAQGVFAPVTDAYQQNPAQDFTPESSRFAQRNTEQTVQQSPSEDPVTSMRKLKQMLDEGFITEEMYEEKVKEVLGRM